MAFVQKAHQGGLTLIEALVTTSILAIVLAIAVPAMQHWQQNMRLKGAADVLVGELRMAQAESIKRQTGVSLNFRTSASGWCYGYSINSACDCTQANACHMDGVETVRRNEPHPGVQLQPGVSGNRFSFQPHRSTVTAGNVLLTGENGKQLRVVVSGLGRIRLCTPSGASQFSGYPVCT